MSEVTKAIAELQRQKIIHVAGYRRSRRTGLDIPVYSLSAARTGGRLDVHGLLAGITSERLVEYDFVSRNLVSRNKEAIILDVGSSGSELAKAIQEFGNRWQVLGMDLAESGCDARMDARSTGFCGGAFDQVICISTVEHIGLSCNINDKNGDAKAMREMFRLLKKRGSAIVTVPYGSGANKLEYRVYDRETLGRLVRDFSIAKKEFYRYDARRWKKCSQAAADWADSQVSLHFHSAACACLLLRKQ
jgi:SAM-dependent methyltransferase